MDMKIDVTNRLYGKIVVEKEKGVGRHITGYLLRQEAETSSQTAKLYAGTVTLRHYEEVRYLTTRAATTAPNIVLAPGLLDALADARSSQ